MEELVESILDYVRADYTDYNKIESMTLNRKIFYDNIHVTIPEYQT